MYTVGGETEIFHRPEITYHPENLAAGVGRPGEDYPEGVGTLIEASQ